MKTKTFLALSLMQVVLTMLSIACARSGTTTTTPSATTTTSPTTIQPGINSPTVDELKKLNYPDPETPRISAYQLKLMMDRDDPFLVVDVRQRTDFDMGHLPGALNITISCVPDLQNDGAAIARLMALPRDRLIVLY
jgi:hypothetical protein